MSEHPSISPSTAAETFALRVESHVQRLANTNMSLSLEAWGVIANDLLIAARMLRAKSSDGGVEVRHAETGNMPGSVPGEEVSSTATSLERSTVQGAAIQPCAGVTPGPSDAITRPALREGGYFLTRGNKNNSRQVIGPLKTNDDPEWPWKAEVYGSTWLWRDDGTGVSEVRDIIGDEVYAWPNQFNAGAQTSWMPSAPVKPRRPFEDKRPYGMLESDLDYLENNCEVAVELLEHYSTLTPTDVPAQSESRCDNCGRMFLPDDTVFASVNHGVRRTVHLKCEPAQKPGASVNFADAHRQVQQYEADNGEAFRDMSAYLWAAGASLEDADFIARMLALKGLYLFQTEPWKRCPSTHCERRGECSGPRDCTIKVPAPVQPSTASTAWLPIETAPKDGTPVDLFSKSGRRWCNYRWDKDFNYEAWSDVAHRNREWRDRPFMHASSVTHWMPIPTAPALIATQRDGEAT